MTNYKEIIRLHSLGLNKTRIAESCGCARSTVITALHKAEENGLSWNAVKNLSSEEVTRKLYPATSMGQRYSMPDYEWVHKEMQKSGVTLSLLWVEYCERCRQNGELPYKSTQFNKYYADYVHKTKATMHLEHKPSENLQVDWAGQTAGITDTDTGERLPAYLFVAVLPYSGYAYTEAFLNMKQEAWITAHVHAYNYFGGVTRILTPDNLKTGVIKNTRTETVLNKAYQEMAEHYGTAIIPTCPRTSKDKAFVEGSVGVVSTWILAALRNRQFLSLDELNRAIWEKLADFNHKPFQKKDGSRVSDFEEEKLFLLPLPPNPFELAEWKTATVQYNYHISVDHMNYSVPYEYIKQKVDVRLTGSAVEIYFCGTRVAFHLRLYGRPNQYSTLEEHMLETENPGCFDDPDKTFIDLYMKSCLYITEIVKRLYQSERMKEQFPDPKERLRHIFEKQVYGLAPTEIIYHIALSYILGFNEGMEDIKHNFRQLDALPYAKEGTLQEKLDELFG